MFVLFYHFDSRLKGDSMDFIWHFLRLFFSNSTLEHRPILDCFFFTSRCVNLIYPSELFLCDDSRDGQRELLLGKVERVIGHRDAELAGILSRWQVSPQDGIVGHAEERHQAVIRLVVEPHLPRERRAEEKWVWRPRGLFHTSPSNCNYWGWARFLRISSRKRVSGNVPVILFLRIKYLFLYAPTLSHLFVRTLLRRSWWWDWKMFF